MADDGPEDLIPLGSTRVSDTLNAVPDHGPPFPLQDHGMKQWATI